ncbi:MAG: guanylate kinase [Bacteroidetes bacterium]|nr:guanylate kinase [Bacteroidota bacterium]MDA0903607.1 guanylate kinase [Bacteroidota bacterium]MDA1242086.1 guanylate kinase [Bacteroidota bacterium]
MPAGTKPQGDGLAIILSAPSGAGKTTIVRHLMEVDALALGFSVSATTRAPRKGEMDGLDYHFLTPQDFQRKVKDGEFVEYEEVYEGVSYGTLCSEVEGLWRDGRTPLFDVDVVGGQTLKSVFGDSALSIFVMPPSLHVLEQRLRGRGTESQEDLARRLAKSEQEMEAAGAFDMRLVNDDLEDALAEATDMVGDFLRRGFL